MDPFIQEDLKSVGYKPSSIDFKTRSIRKMQNYTTAYWNQPGSKRKSAAPKQLEFGAHGLLRQLKKEGTLLPLINKHKKAQQFVVTSCRRFL